MKRKGSWRIKDMSHDEIASLFLPDHVLVRGPIPTAVCSLESIAEEERSAGSCQQEETLQDLAILTMPNLNIRVQIQKLPPTCARLSLPGWSKVQCRAASS